MYILYVYVTSTPNLGLVRGCTLNWKSFKKLIRHFEGSLFPDREADGKGGQGEEPFQQAILSCFNSVISAGKSRVLHPNNSMSSGSALGFNSNNTQTVMTLHNTLVTA